MTCYSIKREWRLRHDPKMRAEERWWVKWSAGEFLSVVVIHTLEHACRILKSAIAAVVPWSKGRKAG